MDNLHDRTNHSYKSVRMNAFYLDWRTQPKNFKIYPFFHHRIKIDDYEILNDLDLIGGITFEKTYPDGTYYLRTNPSAGALYPCEVYLQLRGLKGILDGIYHYEPLKKELVLLHEVANDGIEYYFKDKSKQEGVVFLISSVYFRSSWKYRNRSLRYIFLDSGHQLGAIYAALCVMDKNSKIEFDFDKIGLNDIFGFRNDEMFTTALRSSFPKEKTAAPLTLQLPYVCPCDYLQKNRFLEDGYKQTADFSDEPIENLNFFKDIPKERLKSAIINRRSIRAFRKDFISKEEFDFIVQDIFSFAKLHNIEIFYTLHKVTNMIQGLYKENQLISQGDFSNRSRYLSLEQNLGGDSAVTFYFTSNESEKYQKANILCGFCAQIIYLRCELKNIGCSGIGAYYDLECQEFLKTSNNILYLLAIGR